MSHHIETAWIADLCVGDEVARARAGYRHYQLGTVTSITETIVRVTWHGQTRPTEYHRRGRVAGHERKRNPSGFSLPPRLERVTKEIRDLVAHDSNVDWLLRLADEARRTADIPSAALAAARKAFEESV